MTPESSLGSLDMAGLNTAFMCASEVCLCLGELPGHPHTSIPLRPTATVVFPIDEGAPGIRTYEKTELNYITCIMFTAAGTRLVFLLTAPSVMADLFRRVGVFPPEQTYLLAFARAKGTLFLVLLATALLPGQSSTAERF